MSWSDDIKDKVYRRVPELQSDDENIEMLCEDLIDDAFRAIVNYSKEDGYNKEWDSVLVRCVAMLYNNVGVEGSTYRKSLDNSDGFDTIGIIGSYLQGAITQNIRPTGYKYPATRFTYPN